MASERPVGRPKGKSNNGAMVTLAKGKPWETQESREVLRDRERTVDEQGNRHIEWLKDDSTMENNRMVRQYKTLGYDIKDHGEYLEAIIPDSVYRKNIEAKQHQDGIDRVSRARAVVQRRPDAEGIYDVDTDPNELEPLSPEDLK